MTVNVLSDTFPFLKTGIKYLDSAASTQKPKAVLDAINDFYSSHYANVHRGLHRLAEDSTVRYEGARSKVAGFLHAESGNEIVFTKGTTEAMNLLAQTYPLSPDDTVIVSGLDHHSTFVPWQQAALRSGATFKVLPINDDGTLDYASAEDIIDKGCTVLAITHLSNVTGELIDVERLADLVHKRAGVIVVDGAQAAAHIDIDVKKLGIDAYCISGHKMYGPTGIGALYCREEILATLPPFQFGGEMVDKVTIQETTFASAPMRFEAGTPPIAQTIGLAAAIDWLRAVKDGWDNEQLCVDAAYKRLSELSFITIIGPKERKALISFVVDGVHAHDVAQFLDSKGIAIRAGHHCTQPLHDRLGIAASCRASFGLYNRKEDIDALIDALKECKEAFDV